MPHQIKIFASLALISSNALAETLQINCGEPSGYSCYFEGGLVTKDKAQCIEDGITNGQVTLVLQDDEEAGETGDVISRDATDTLKSATSQGGRVVIIGNDKGINWLTLYPDGTIEVQSLRLESKTMISYRNTVTSDIPKNSILVSKCSLPLQ